MLVFYQWVFAHLFVDFVLQSKKMVENKKRLGYRSGVLYFHCFLQAFAVYLVTPDKNLWMVPVIIFITHFIIDLWKLNQKENLLSFIIDQALHMIVLLLLWLWLYQPESWLQTKLLDWLNNKTLWLLATGYLFVIFPLAYMLGYATQKWRKEAEEDLDRSAISLSEAGKWIGIFERILVLTFILTTHYEGIGFLIAAKSILRFNDIKGHNVRKEAEYVLIGTLMSFSASIITGLIVIQLMK